MFNSNGTLPQELEIHRGKVDVTTSELLRDFLYERHAHTQDYLSSSRLLDHTLNTNTHFRPDISYAASELRNAASIIRNSKN